MSGCWDMLTPTPLGNLFVEAICSYSFSFSIISEWRPFTSREFLSGGSWALLGCAYFYFWRDSHYLIDFIGFCMFSERFSFSRPCVSPLKILKEFDLRKILFCVV